MKQLFDYILSFVLLLLMSLFVLFLALLVKLTSKGPVLYISNRVGTQNKIFKMYKFRTMKIDTPPVATHLLYNSDQFLTPIGRVLRKYSLDEIPQLFNILKGDMSFVGPRPALYNQDDLIGLRTKKAVSEIITGLTGWAQINGRDDLPIPVKVEFDKYYLENRSFLLDLKIIFLTIIKSISKDGVSH
ncbi:MAG: sugar transferase [Candidatus Brocadiaceae bacterium]|nr:sugar transferase [Candidatus Brocadiaceae bacterium]